MPVNKNALLRYQVIDKCLHNRGRKWTWKDILEAVNEAILKNDPESKGVGKTTIFEDLKDIEYRVYKAEITKVTEGRTVYYSYTDINYSINNQPLNETEVKQLKSAVMVLSRFKGMPQFDWVNEIVLIIESKMGLVNIEKEIISFENNIDYSGTKYISTLFNAVLNKRVVKITYQDFKKNTPYDVEIHPQYLKQYNSRWFLMSFMSNWPKRPQTHALDRIKNIREVNTEYIDLKDFNWDDYFADMIGVTRFDERPVEVKLQILDEEQAAYINTKPLHQSQKKIKKSDEGFETSINVIHNYELEKLILSFGERIKILGPALLKEKVKSRIEKLYHMYQ